MRAVDLAKCHRCNKPLTFCYCCCCCCATLRCLVLDSRYLPVNVISWFRAVVMDESGKVCGACRCCACLGA